MSKIVKGAITKYYKWGSPNVTIVGSPTVSNGVVSGFTTSNYLRTTGVTFSSNWEICVKFTTGSNITTNAWVIGGGGSFTRLLVGYQNSKFLIILSSNNSSANLANTTGSYTIKTNTTYWLKVQFTGTQYIMSYSTDGKNFTTDYTLTSSTKLYEDGKPLSLGANQFTTGVNYPMTTGSIDLKECYIKQNGNITWRGMTMISGSPSDYNLSEQVERYTVPTKIHRTYYKYNYESWTQPTATGNTTAITGGNMIISASSTYSSYHPYLAFNKNTTSDFWTVDNATSSWWQVKFPYKIKITGLTFYEKSGSKHTDTVTAYTSSSKTTKIGNTTTVNKTNYSATTIGGISANGVVTDTIYLEFAASSGGAGMAELVVTATKQVVKESSVGDYDFYQDKVIYYCIED